MKSLEKVFSRSIGSIMQGEVMMPKDKRSVFHYMLHEGISCRLNEQDKIEIAGVEDKYVDKYISTVIPMIWLKKYYKQELRGEYAVKNEKV